LDLRLINGCVHPGYAEAGCNCFSKSSKASFIEKKAREAVDNPQLWKDDPPEFILDIIANNWLSLKKEEVHVCT
jgi:hypothetical protein